MSTGPEGSPMILTLDQRVRVFVSSTLGELGEERGTVGRVIKNDLGLHPVMFEAGARPHPPRDVYRASLEQSHVYLGIFWESYGWVAPDMEVSGIEDEYNLSSGKKRLIYVKRSEGQRDPGLERLLERIRNESTVTYTQFSTVEELAELVKNDLAHLLSESFLLNFAWSSSTSDREQLAPAYSDALRAEMDTRTLIERVDLIAEVRERLEGTGKMLLEGNPGIGKTFLLGELAAEPTTVYVPLRNKTTQQVCSYLATHLAARRGSPPRSAPSEADALSELQQELANGRATLLIDEADQNPATARALLGLELYACHALFAARHPIPEVFGDLRRHRVPPFDRDEISRFLEANNMSVEPGELQRLSAASEGNPLYLYFFTKNPVFPLPEDLQGYQRVLWEDLAPRQQEAVNLVAHSIAPLDISDLHNLLHGQQLSTSVMETKQLLASASSLIQYTGRGYELFHAYFEEFVRASASSDGLSVHYHQLLGDHAVAKEATMAAGYHLLRAGDSRSHQYVLDGARVALLHGDWALAEELLCAAIESFEQEENLYEGAVARHLLAELYRESGRYSEAHQEIEKASRVFDQLGEEEWKRQIDLASNLLLIQEGRAEETIERLTETLENTEDEEDRGMLSLNLAYAYVHANRYKEGAEEAEHALNLFERTGDDIGVYGSLTNLASCAGELGDHALQGQYADRIIEAAKTRDIPRLEAAGLNHRAAAQRAVGEAVSAQRTLEDCVAIHQRLGNIEGEVLNIANLGNTFLDQEKYPEAGAAYAESLAKAREAGLPRHEGHALELLARLKQREAEKERSLDLHKEALELGNEALAIQKSLGERLRIANTQGYLANSYEALGQYREAAGGREEAGDYHETIQMWESAADQYERAAVLWNVLEERDHAARCVERWTRCQVLSEEPELEAEALAEALEEVSEAPQGDESGDYYRRALRTIAIRTEDASLTHLVRSLAIYCKKHHDPDEKKHFKLALEDIVAELARLSSPRLLRAAAVGIEQADEGVLPLSSLDALAKRLTDPLEHLHYRFAPDEWRTWTIGLEWQRPLVAQVVCMSEDHASVRVSAALALLVRSDGTAIDGAILAYGGSQEDGFALHLMSQDEAVQEGGMPDSLFDGDSLPVTATDSNVPWGDPQPPTYMILRSDYEYVSDFTIEPYNKALAWILGYAAASLIAHCVHRLRNDTPDIGKEAAKFSNLVLE